MSARSLTLHNDTSTLSNSNKNRLIDFIKIKKYEKERLVEGEKNKLSETVIMYLQYK